jgi:hypothetical protein
VTDAICRNTGWPAWLYPSRHQGNWKNVIERAYSSAVHARGAPSSPASPNAATKRPTSQPKSAWKTENARHSATITSTPTGMGMPPYCMTTSAVQ